MSERGITESLADIIEAIKRIRDYTGDMDYYSFLDDLKTRDAVTRNLEIIVEASKNIKDDFRKKYPDLAWIVGKGTGQENV